jgi:hypothetical protein
MEPWAMMKGCKSVYRPSQGTTKAGAANAVQEMECRTGGYAGKFALAGINVEVNGRNKTGGPNEAARHGNRLLLEESASP